MGQLKLTFELRKSELPRELDRLLVSFFKSSIQNYSQEMFEKLYDKSKSVMKTYTFSYHLPGACFTQNAILLRENEFSVFFSDVDFGEFLHFFNAFRLMKFKEYPISNNCMSLISVGVKKSATIKESEIVVKMLGSLLVREHDKELNKDIYYTYDQSGFADVVKKNVCYFLEAAGIPISGESFNIVPIKAKKVVVPVFGRNTDANIGIYKLTGEPELLNVLYLAGLGSRRSEGHGRFEILW